MTNRVKLNVGNLKAAVAKARLKKMDLAEDIGISRETFSRWLAGKVDYIDEGKARKLSAILGCELSWLSPEIPGEDQIAAHPLNPSERIRGDDFLRLGLYTGLWREVSLLYRTSVHPDVLEHGSVNRALCEALQALMEMNGTSLDRWARPLTPESKRYELFEIVAKANLCEGLGLLFKGRMDEGHQLIKRVVVQGQSEWIVSLAYLLSGLCYSLQNRPSEAYETWNRGLQSFPGSKDDLTMFIQSNLHFACFLARVDSDPEQSALPLENARELMDAIGYRWGHARCLAYEALLLALQNKKSDALEKCRELSGFVHGLPRLYQFEAFVLLARVQKILGHEDQSLQYREMAAELIQGPSFLETFVYRRDEMKRSRQKGVK